MKTGQQMTILLSIILFCSMPLEMFAQQNRFKDERRIYLWDVTLSMKGFQERTPDIYDKVVTALEKDINSILDEQTEIWVLPFQMGIIEKWNVKATNKGKKEIIDKIKRFNNNDVTNTNITLPMKEVMTSLINANKRNVLILLTDGVHNAKGYPLSGLLDLINQWCNFAEHNDAHAFYVMLTSFAINEDLIKVIDETCHISKVISGPELDLNFIELLPQENYKYNIKDNLNKKVRIKVDCKKRVSIPKSLKLHCFCDTNPYVTIEQTVSMTNGMIEFDVHPTQSYDELKHALPQDTNEKIAIHFSIENPDQHPLVQLINEECALELINKPEKILKVYVKD